MDATMIDTLNRAVIQPLMAFRSGSKHLRYLRLLRQTQYDPPHVIRHRQWLAVRTMLQHVYDTVSFYRARFDDLGLHPNDITCLEELNRLPILTKTDIRTHAAELRSEAYRGTKLALKRTSGSTGVPLEIAIDQPSIEWKRACTIRSDEWSGWRLGMRVAKVWGNPEYRRQGWKGRLRNLLVDRAVYLDTLGLNDDRMRGFLEQLRDRRPGLLFGHAHSLYLLACFVRKHAPQPFRPDGIISTAMVLHQHEREAIEEAFGCPVTNRYGCEEASLLASECEQHRGLHLNADSVFAEVVHDECQDHAPGNGALVVTDLTNFAMPLIRYQVGDVVTSSERLCPCGRGLPLIEKVEGREADYVVTPAGKLISGISLTENFALHIRGAAQVQIVQEELQFLRVRMVPGDDFDDRSLAEIAALVCGTFGPTMRHEVELVDRI